ncbi:hypothetical protein GCM10027440_22340 [Nocardiopsis coralliicola]
MPLPPMSTPRPAPCAGSARRAGGGAAPVAAAWGLLFAIRILLMPARPLPDAPLPTPLPLQPPLHSPDAPPGADYARAVLDGYAGRSRTPSPGLRGAAAPCRDPPVRCAQPIRRLRAGTVTTTRRDERQ